MSEFTVTGRLVQGDPHKQGNPPKDRKTKQVKIGKDGQPMPGRFFTAVAIPKNPAQRLQIPGMTPFEQTKAQLDADARAAWPQFFGTPLPGAPAVGPELPAGCTNPNFANKIIDGDGFDENGQPFSTREGYAGCWVVKADSQFAPKVWEWGASGWQEMGGPTGRFVKCGDYVSITGTCTSNQSQESPGMYMNLNAVTFEQEGPAIVSAAAVDPNAAFGARGTPGNAAPAANPAPPVHTAPTSPTAAPGNPAPPPYAGYMAPPANPPAPPVAPVPAGPTMTAKAAGATYESFIAQGWTDETMRQHGYIV
jgi:hypothetical protein